MNAAAGGPDGLRSPRLSSVLVLCAIIFLLWSCWTLILRERFTGEAHHLEHALGVVARVVCWLIPCGIYLVRARGSQWSYPLGLGFPLGMAQVKRTLLLSLLITWVLFAATAARNGTSIQYALERFVAAAQLRFTAPIFEELVFRGTILAEWLEWTHRSSGSLNALRRRYWISQLSCASFFVLIHWPVWWEFLGYSAILERSLPIFAVAMVLGFVFAQTRSIWPCIWIHWLNNELSLMA